MSPRQRRGIYFGDYACELVNRGSALMVLERVFRIGFRTIKNNRLTIGCNNRLLQSNCNNRLNEILK